MTRLRQRGGIIRRTGCTWTHGKHRQGFLIEHHAGDANGGGGRGGVDKRLCVVKGQLGAVEIVI